MNRPGPAARRIASIFLNEQLGRLDAVLDVDPGRPAVDESDGQVRNGARIALIPAFHVNAQRHSHHARDRLGGGDQFLGRQ